MSVRLSSRLRVLFLVLLIGGGAAGRARGETPADVSYSHAGAALREAVATASEFRDPTPPESKTVHHRGGFLRSLFRGVLTAAFLPINIWGLQSGYGPLLELPDSRKAPLNSSSSVQKIESPRSGRSAVDLFEARSREEALDILEGEVGELARHDLVAAVTAAQGARTDPLREKLVRAAFRGSLRQAAFELADGQRAEAVARYAAVIDRARHSEQSMAAVVARAAGAACLRLRDADLAKARELAERTALLLSRLPIGDHENVAAAHALRIAWMVREHPGEVSASIAGVPAYLRDDASTLAGLCIGADLPAAADQLLTGADGTSIRQLCRRLAAEAIRFGREHPGTHLPVPEDLDLTGVQAVPSIAAYMQEVMEAFPELGSAMLSRANRDTLLQSTGVELSQPEFPLAERVVATSELFRLWSSLAERGVDVRASAGPPELRLLTLGASLSGSHDPSALDERIGEIRTTLGQLLNARSLPPIPDLTVGLAFAAIGRAAPERVPELITSVVGESARLTALQMAAHAAADARGLDVGFRITELIESPTARFAARRRIAMSFVERNDPNGIAPFARSCAATVRCDTKPDGEAGAEATEAVRDFCWVMGRIAPSEGVSGVHRLLDRLGDDGSGPIRRLHVIGLCFAVPIIEEKDRQAAGQLLNEAGFITPRSSVADSELTAVKAVASGYLDGSSGAAAIETLRDSGSQAMARVMLGGRLLTKDRAAGMKLLERVKHDLGTIKDSRRRAEVAFVLAQAWQQPEWTRSWPRVDPEFWRAVRPKG